MREIKFVPGEFYHIYNRGVDKRNIFLSEKDLDRFIEGIKLFNTIEKVGHLDRRHPVTTDDKLVEFVAYCLNPNHFHFIVTPTVDGGIEKFMHRVCMGYSKFFNLKYKRSGTLFQGRFRAKHIDSNEYLLHLSAYVNLNNSNISGISKSSWGEYLNNNEKVICKKGIILDQFGNIDEYKIFAKNSYEDTVKRKGGLDELLTFGMELINTK